jgi:hypothetical protein
VIDYLNVLDQLHRVLLPRTYLEIGVETGQSLAFVLDGTEAIGVDPRPKIRFALPPDAAVFPMTSDEYFAGHDRPFDRPIDLAFIDGMHLFEFVLRDFANIEARAHRDAVIAIHDCNPVDELTSQRERANRMWSGDVWRALAVLRSARPDLRIVTFDVPPTGLALVTALDPDSDLIVSRYDELVEQGGAMPFPESAALRSTYLNVQPYSAEALRAFLPPAFCSGDLASLLDQRDRRRMTVKAAVARGAWRAKERVFQGR